MGFFEDGFPDDVTFERAYTKLVLKLNYTEDWRPEDFVHMRMISVLDPVVWNPENHAVVTAEWKWQMERYA